MRNTEDGSPSVFSHTYDELYHSSRGSIQESIIVFIRNGLLAKEAQRPISILELGFGTGLNAMLTFVYGDYHGYQIDYTAYELHPLPLNVVDKLNYKNHIHHPNYDRCWSQLHEAPDHSPLTITDHFNLTKYQKTFDKISEASAFDLIYHDAFSPAVQPTYWQQPFIDQLYKALTPGGTLTTYCAKGSFKRALREAGFKVEGRKGPKGKREITVAYKL